MICVMRIENYLPDHCFQLYSLQTLLIVLYLYTTLYTVTRVAITDNFLPKKDLFPWGKYMLIGCLKSKFLSKFGQKTHEIYFCIILFFKNSNFA